MNPLLESLQPYPFEKLARLKAGIEPPQDLSPIALSIGEPQHPTPSVIRDALIQHLDGLTQYPQTKGILPLRESISSWLSRRFTLPLGSIDPESMVLPCGGTREALFAFAQTVVDRSKDTLVLMPNPFYQIYEGATLLAGATPYFLNTTRESGYRPDFERVPESVWKRCQLLYICSPGNPTGAVLDEACLQSLIERAERYDFVIASDECYSELYRDEENPPAGLLGASYRMGQPNFRRCIVFHSLSKRSNAPGLRSGFVAGDPEILKQFLTYRTYHGAALSVPVQMASMAAWDDEQHVIENRALYRQKFLEVSRVLSEVLDFNLPPAGFYLWPQTPTDDPLFARELYRHTNVTVLPGSFLSRESEGINPGRQHVRMALVAPLAECVEAAHRIKHFIHSHH